MSTEDDYKINVSPGTFVYRSIDGTRIDIAGPDPWMPGDRMTDADVFNLRARCIRTLRKLEDELVSRGMFGRYTEDPR